MHIEIEPPKNPKKITGTRLGAILGLNQWCTPFEAWCEITRTYQKPFEDNIYTIAGKTIEPKQAQFMRDMYGMKLIAPADKYGADYFNKTHGDFFPEHPIFGGMWDYLRVGEDGNVDAVLEMKTTKRVEDWIDEVPPYYAVQAKLYGRLMNVKTVVMVVSFLDEPNYANPSAFEVSTNNTLVKVLEVDKDFDNVLYDADLWWNLHVISGISPEYDEKKDAEILKVLQTKYVSPDTDIMDLIRHAEALRDEIDPLNKKLKVLTDAIKKHAITQMGEDKTKVVLNGEKYNWNISKSKTTKLDKDKLKADGLLDLYLVEEETYRMTCERRK